MERYGREALTATHEKAPRLLGNQGAPLQQYVAFFRENFLMIDGKVRF